jgi:hypothetical protein
MQQIIASMLLSATVMPQKGRHNPYTTSSNEVSKA